MGRRHEPQIRFVSVEVEIRLSPKIQFTHWYDKPIRVDVAGRSLIRRLASFFPGVGVGRRSNTAGGWFPGVVVRFRDVRGSETTVYVDPKFRHWTELLGDWPVVPGFGEFLEELVANSW